MLKFSIIRVKLEIHPNDGGTIVERGFVGSPFLIARLTLVKLKKHIVRHINFFIVFNFF
jgi:hypothetical protein